MTLASPVAPLTTVAAPAATARSVTVPVAVVTMTACPAASARRVAAPVEPVVPTFPEGHPDTRTLDAELDNLKRKIDAGAPRAITQFFFDNWTFLRFVDRARKAGIEVPI